MKHHDEKITWEDRVYFSLYFTITITIIHQGRSKQEHKKGQRLGDRSECGDYRGL